MESDFIKPFVESPLSDIAALKEIGKNYEKLFIVAVVLVIDNSGKVLIIQRNSKTGYDTWAFPGGKVDEHDSTLKAAAKRELLEEVRIKADELIQIPDILHVGLGNAHSLNAIFIFRVESNETTILTINEKEVKDFKWVDPSELPANFFLPNSPIKENWRSIVSPHIYN